LKDNNGVLTAAALGMFSYGAYSVAWAVVDLVGPCRLAVWADLGLAVFGILLVVSAAFVRVRLPGGLALALGAMLGLQALAVHSAYRLDAGLAPQIGRGVLAIVLVGLALCAGDEARGAGGSADGRPAPPNWKR
jgi:hypothetical protein